MIKEAIIQLAAKQDLSYETAAAVMDEIMSGQASQIQMASFLTALAIKGETIDEITACAAGMRAHCVRLLHDVDALEIVGTGGDNAGSFNISTTAALVTAAGGGKVAKHGNRAASSKSGAADVLEALGVNIALSPEQSAELLRRQNFCFLFAQNYHISMKYVAPVRKELGIRTVFNILGPLSNPAGANRELMGVYDETRMGAIRFKLDKDGPFLSDDSKTPTPPWTSLRTLEEASRQFENDESGLEQKWINQLIKPGSSLGGARPKATVLDTSGNLWIAKFPSKHDDVNVGAWEKVTHDLARLCGLDVPESMLIDFSKYGSTFLVRRFDRNGAARIHFASAMTMLGKTDGASAADGSSYLELVSFIKANGAAPKRDLTELWKRIVFNMAVSNTDDHMRNHGFILKADGWHLSPLYDVNPVPEGDELSLCVNEDDATISLDLALEIAPYCEISTKDATAMAADVLKTVRDNWNRLAAECGLSRSAQEYMRPAFSLALE